MRGMRGLSCGVLAVLLLALAACGVDDRGGRRHHAAGAYIGGGAGYGG
ncbi:hypothetical protein ACLRDC_10525 [Gluconacetobacter sacchari]|uniref:Lipoprotein n=1 Tax=Gluconacetobacter sacchari TaxID=92759 RepID=A0A7W4NK68_9PROT|nr:hypothetical protein [Gluconacetobacter sacchari]MBB2159237.1 hypothetical protein [Gluconacetobacter sacchari]